MVVLVMKPSFQTVALRAVRLTRAVVGVAGVLTADAERRTLAESRGECNSGLQALNAAAHPVDASAMTNVIAKSDRIGRRTIPQ